MTDVDPELFYDAGIAYKVISDEMAGAVTKATAAADTANGAGSNPIGVAWSSKFDSLALEVSEVAFRTSNAINNIGSLLWQNGVNHDQSEEASTFNQYDQHGAPAIPPGDSNGTHIDSITAPGSVAGGDDPEPNHWNLVSGQIDEGWLNGDPSKVTAAGLIWATFGEALVQANDLPGIEEYRLLTEVDAAEIAAVIDRCNSARACGTDVAAAAGDLARAAADYGADLSVTKSVITGILKSLGGIVAIFNNYPPSTDKVAEALSAALIRLAVTQITYLIDQHRINAELTHTGMNNAATQMVTNLTEVKTLLALVPRNVNPTPATRVDHNRRKGRRAEDIAGIDPTAEKRQIVVNDRIRIPDETNDETKVIREVKNVANLSATSQIRDMAQWAKENGYTMVIVIDKGRTKVGGGITELMNSPEYKDVVSIDGSLNLS